ncbi:MAG: pyruvate ferredoxin oxidoreductase [Candidatus Micrarchaeota archaeon]|nr:pyruvate ferredoxin oxidoreductase [Candidatus Micrarchaeota archaeon]
MKDLIDGNAAAAWGARLSRVMVVPNFPITPQTEIIETLAKWKETGEWTGEFLPMESEHSVLSAAVASEAAGARTFTASSSQGLVLMKEIHYVASGMRLPIVMVNCSRGLAAPITLWPDNNDFLSLRDSGWLMFFAQNNQEVLDFIIMAYKISENRDVLLPSIVNMEGFILSYTREPIEIPAQDVVDSFLPEYRPKVLLDPEKPMSLGVPSLHEYMYFRSQVHKAQMNALNVAERVFSEFEKTFGRSYGLVEKYMTDDADSVFVTTGSLSTTVKAAVNALRNEGRKFGLVRIVCYRPFPKKELEFLSNFENVIVLDNNLSPGMGGIVFSELRNLATAGVVVSLGGKHIGRDDFVKIGKKLSGAKGEFWYFGEKTV